MAITAAYIITGGKEEERYQAAQILKKTDPLHQVSVFESARNKKLGVIFYETARDIRDENSGSFSFDHVQQIAGLKTLDILSLHPEALPPFGVLRLG